MPTQGEIWWAQAEDERRPVLVVTRVEAVPVLTWITVAPVTRTILPLGQRQGLRDDCLASFGNLQPIRRSFLTQRVGALGVDGRREMCRALRAFSDC